VFSSGKMGRVLEVSGRLENLKLAVYAYEYVHNFLSNSWEKYKADHDVSSRQRSSFMCGILEGFMAKLKSAVNSGLPETRKQPSCSVILSKDQGLRRYMKDKYPLITKRRVAHSAGDPNVRRDGRKIGKKLVIHKPIAKRAGNRRKAMKSR